MGWARERRERDRHREVSGRGPDMRTNRDCAAAAERPASSEQRVYVREARRQGRATS